MRNFPFSIRNVNWFYLSLIIFIISLPLGESLISISIGILFFVSLFYIKKGKQLKQRKYLFFILSIYLVYLIGSIFCNDLKWGMYDLRKCMAYLFIPLAFIFGDTINKRQQKKILYFFIFAIVVSSVITLITFYLKDNSTVLSAQEAGFIHHIRFSMQLNFSMIILAILFLFEPKSNKYLHIAYPILFLFLFVFMLWHQSFTGILTFIGTSFAGIILLIFSIRNQTKRTIFISLLIIMILIPSLFLYYSVNKFYTIEQVDYSNLKQNTPDGNIYQHDIQNKQVENGNYIWLYICDKELKDAWNKRSEIGYNELDCNGYPINATLIRYLTSLGLKKDRQGVEALGKNDINNIEHGISNYILAQKGLSLYPRIYVSLWELDTYFKTGYANHQSLSQRIEYVKAAIYIIKNNFWFGVGTGNWKKAYTDAYRHNKSKMDPARYGDAHNQYLNYMVKFGLIGLLWIFFAIIYPVIKTEKYKNPIFLLFLISMFISNFGDSNFETHVGGAFFVFIYCLLFSSEEIELKSKG